MSKFLFVFLFLFLGGTLFSQNPSLDVEHYRFMLSLSDSTDQIQGEAQITFTSKVKTDQVYFDLVSPKEKETKGMMVLSVTQKGKNLSFTQKSDRVYLYFQKELPADQKETVVIKYQGIPADGLIIDQNKFGKRTFFTDNWPERARHWLPTNDHPSDKASVEFIVEAPAHYQVVGNGLRQSEISLPEGRRQTHWSMQQKIPTKVMAIGVADFAVKRDTLIEQIPIETWVFTDNQTQGFAQYAIGRPILPFLTRYIAAFPFRKLANVQSKTRFGGMENASNIFYFENSVKVDPPVSTSERIKLEALMAHEMAHQWFGNMVSESDWEHLWLSEGFATYMTDLYLEHSHGTDFIKERLQTERKQALDFSRDVQRPVVDTLGKENLMGLLNPNSYQKGAWVLHMLRQRLGDAVFKQCIQAFYQRYKGENATTADFEQLCQEVSGADLRTFFRQWLHLAQHPVLAVSWHYDSTRKQVELQIEQKQQEAFEFPLEIAFSDGQMNTTKQLEIREQQEGFTIPLPYRPQSVQLDPQVKVFFEVSALQEK